MAERPAILDLYLDFIERVSISDQDKLAEKDKALKAATDNLKGAIKAAEAAGNWGPLHIEGAMQSIRDALQTIEKILEELKKKK